MKQKSNIQATQTTDVPHDAKSGRSSVGVLSIVQNDLIDLLREEANEEYGIPALSDAAFRYAWNILAQVEDIMKESFPYGSVSSDGEGGVHIEWRQEDRGVRLAVPANVDKRYIYYEKGSDFALDKKVSASVLSTHLAELMQQ
jgi:hypothetical protein